LPVNLGQAEVHFSCPVRENPIAKHPHEQTPRAHLVIGGSNARENQQSRADGGHRFARHGDFGVGYALQQGDHLDFNLHLITWNGYKIADNHHKPLVMLEEHLFVTENRVGPLEFEKVAK
jgi:hypothetical protein